MMKFILFEGDEIPLSGQSGLSVFLTAWEKASALLYWRNRNQKEFLKLLVPLLDLTCRES